jgi:dolichol-phosphate mannosyltransferase
MKKNEILIFFATYNERDNIQPLYDKIRSLPIQADILVVDDNSPDGTGKVLDELAIKDPAVSIIHRPKKLGLGTAHIVAFNFARTNGYEYLLTLDADLTHDPKYIPNMLEKIKTADIVIGSRYTEGGSMHGWNILRLPLTYFWRYLIRYGLSLPYDCNTAFRLYKISVLKPELYTNISGKGFAFFMESLYQFNKTTTIAEVPIEAHRRIHGTSKLSVNIMAEVAKTFLVLLFDRITRLHGWC